MTDVNSVGSLSPRWTSSSPARIWGILPPPTSEAEKGLQRGGGWYMYSQYLLICYISYETGWYLNMVSSYLILKNIFSETHFSRILSVRYSGKIFLLSHIAAELELHSTLVSSWSHLLNPSNWSIKKNMFKQLIWFISTTLEKADIGRLKRVFTTWNCICIFLEK